MEAAHATPSAPAELVLQNGRPDGSRRAVTAALTLLGRAPGCDMRLNAHGVSLQHCALALVPEGLVLRDLESESGTLVNGERVTACTLRHGDVVSVGPFQFLVQLPADGTGSGIVPLGVAALHDMEVVRKEKEALRIQAAAVAAQQAALTEEEIRLKQRAVALERQEEQLAAHLEERRRQLTALQVQVRDARASLRRERTAFEEQSRQLLQDVEQARSEAAEAQKLAEEDRKRLTSLRGRLKRRWHRHWAAERRAMLRRERQVEDQARALEHAAERLQQDRDGLAQAHLRFNGEVELGRRRIQADRDALAREQCQWADQCARLQTAHSQQTRALAAREAALADVERELMAEKERWLGGRVRLEQEAEGLENRIRNQRRRLLEQQEEITRVGTALQGLKERAATPALATVPETAESPQYIPVPMAEIVQPPSYSESATLWQERLRFLEILAGELADQRLWLAEQGERLLRAREDWRQAQEAVSAELEEAARSLQRREDTLAAREQLLGSAEAILRHRAEELAQTRRHLDAWQARVAAREAAWETERTSLLARVQSGEEFVRRQLADLDGLRRRWAQRRREEVGRLRTEHQHLQEARRQYAELWEDCLRRSAALEQEKRGVAERLLAMEQYRLELVGKAENAAVVERRLERLRRRWATLYAAADRDLARERRALEAEAARVEARGRAADEKAAQAAAQQAELDARLSSWEQEQARTEGATARLHQELQSLRLQHDLHERQLAGLRDEVERMALTLLEQDGSLPVPSVQAA